MPDWLEGYDSLSLWIIFLILFLMGLWVGVFRADPQLDKKPFKRPMLTFEMAGTPDRSSEVLRLSRENDGAAYDKFRNALLWDFVFLFLYPASTAIACFIATRFLAERGLVAFRFGLIIMALQLLAGMLDAMENFALLRVLRGPIESPWPQVAKWCAIPKFLIVGAGALYAMFGAIVWIVTRFKG